MVNADSTLNRQAKIIELDLASSEYQRLLKGAPDTVTMHSGLVTLMPSQSVGRHSTENYEEALIILAGVGEMRIDGGQVMQLKPMVLAYCPPDTEHDVFNTGTEPLRYIYIVAKAV
jgi:mannose-6-phosphate isomerase-like protein (cupin superfamily)